MPKSIAKGSFLVPRKVRFLAMAMFEQARHCSFGLTKTFIFRFLTEIRSFWHKNTRNIKKCSLLFPHYVPQERCFQLVKKILKELLLGYHFETWPCFATDKWGRISYFIVFISSTSSLEEVFILVLHHIDYKLLPNYRNIGSWADLNVISLFCLACRDK